MVPQSVAGDYEEVLSSVQGDASDLGLAADERLVRGIAWKRKKEHVKREKKKEEKEEEEEEQKERDLVLAVSRDPDV